MTNIDGRMLWSAGAIIATITAAGISVVGDAAIPGSPENPTTAVMSAGFATGETIASGLDAVATAAVATAALVPEPSAQVGSVPAISSDDEQRLAAEIGRLKARDSRQLVSVIRNAFDEQQPEIPLTFLLSIAYNETHGKVLAVSPAGAAGLAQATPSAYLSEPGFNGRLFLTNDYLVGARSYIMKKPLGDAVNIADGLIRSNTPASRARARTLLESAHELQREGMNELHVLEPHAPALFAQRIREADAYNTRALADLGALIERGAPKAEMTSYRDRVRKQFRAMMATQQRSWTAYQKELETERDRLLKRRYGMDASRVIQTRAYEAGEYLAENLDARFSPTEMARFLAAHLTTKQQEARDLGISDEQLDEWTAALYNGGAVNIKRMRAGLMGSLSETEKYMQRIPALSGNLAGMIGSRRS